jgi:putative drug exporter of the RND superfamily
VERWTRYVIRHRWIVVGTWAVVFVLSLAAMSGLADLLTNRFSLPGTDTARAEKILHDEFDQKTTGSFSVVVKAEEPGTARRLVRQVERAAEKAAAELPGGRVTAVVPVSDDVVVASIASDLEAADAKGYTDDMRAAAGSIEGAELLVSGQAAIEHDLDPVFAHDLKIGELFIAIPIALLILVFVFGTLALLIPFLFAAASIPATLAIIWVVAHFMELTTYLQNLVMLIGLGIAIDYSLLVVYRYREELRSAATKEDALLKTMATAGRAVVFSGSAVGIGLALMLFMPLPFMRGFGVGGLVIPLVSIVAALTLLPVLIHFLARPLDRVRLLPRRITKRRDSEYDFWVRLSRWIMRRPGPVAAVTVALLILLTLPVFGLELGPGSNKGIPQDLEGVRGLNIIGDAVGDGALAPTAITIDTGHAG